MDSLEGLGVVLEPLLGVFVLGLITTGPGVVLVPGLGELVLGLMTMGLVVFEPVLGVVPPGLTTTGVTGAGVGETETAGVSVGPYVGMYGVHLAI
jgi:hypothetical protein